MFGNPPSRDMPGTQPIERFPNECFIDRWESEINGHRSAAIPVMADCLFIYDCLGN